MAAALAACADDWAPNLTLAATWESNATHATTSADKIAALQTEADLLASDRYALGKFDALHATLHGRVEWWPRFKGLLRAGGGARLEWRHTFGTGALAPELSAEIGADLFGAREGGRSGTSAFGRLGVRKRFDQHWRAALTHEIAEHYARAAVFDARQNVTTLELGRDVTDVARLTFALSHTDGDVLTYADATRLDLVGQARANREVDTFRRPMNAYAIDARTLGAKFGIIRAVDEHTALVLSYEYRDTDRGAFQFKNHLTTLAIVNQF